MSQEDEDGKALKRTKATVSAPAEGEGAAGLGARPGRSGFMQLTPSAHVDTFCRDNLPPPGQWPELEFTLPGLRYPVPGGPDVGRLADALRMLLATGQVAALGVSCSWHPGHALKQGVFRVHGRDFLLASAGRSSSLS